MYLMCRPTDNMARAMPGEMTMLFFWRGGLQVFAVVAKPRSSLNSKAQSNVWLLLNVIVGLGHLFHLLGLLDQERGCQPLCVWWPRLYKEHTHLKKNNLLGVMVKGGCVGTKACFTVRGCSGILTTCQVPFALWENAFCQSFLIVICRLTWNLDWFCHWKKRIGFLSHLNSSTLPQITFWPPLWKDKTTSVLKVRVARKR